jgi:phenylpropionate dioxygenase-like ring-hydroxylating dioxygenase large terminal subunit
VTVAPAPDVDALVRPTAVHRSIYTDPAIFDREMTAVFAASWCYLAHESQITEPGDYVATSIGGRPVLVTRAPDGTIHALLNRCSHRGALLTHERSGCAKRFTCPYHGWTYSNDGRLVAVPFPGNHPCDDRSELALGQMATASYRGFVFGTLHPDPTDLLTWLGAARPWFDLLVDRHPGGRVTVAPSAQRLEYAGNWKLAWDNAADGMHATFAHRSYNELGRAADTATVLDRDPGDTPMVAMALGAGHMVVDQRPGIERGPWSTMRSMPFAEATAAGLDPGQLDLGTGAMVNLSLFPNLIFVGNQLMVVEPLAVDRTRLVLQLTLSPESPDAVNQLRLRVDEDFVSFGTPDDLDMFERCQRGLSIPEIEWVDVRRGGEQEIDGVVTGPITSEAPQRSYLARWAELMRTDVRTVAR